MSYIPQNQENYDKMLAALRLCRTEEDCKKTALNFAKDPKIAREDIAMARKNRSRVVIRDTPAPKPPEE